jgi:methylenetetrahydrofolate reductase (NADPH)
LSEPIGKEGPALETILARASVEVTAGERLQAIRAHFAPGTPVHVTFLPNDVREKIESTCATLRRAGYEPTPHLTARGFKGADEFERHLEQLSREAFVTRALVIAGDVDRPRGQFASSIDLMRTGLLARFGIRTLLFAGHPEGHPAVDGGTLDAALQEKLALAKAHGHAVEIINQFCFEAEPILAWLRRIRALGIEAPVRIGVAGPANTLTLLKFAVRCGVGNSLRALRRRTGLGKLIEQTEPDEILDEVATQIRQGGLGPVAGMHIYMFGGVQKTADWLARARHKAKPAGGGDEAILGGMTS